MHRLSEQSRIQVLSELLSSQESTDSDCLIQATGYLRHTRRCGEKKNVFYLNHVDLSVIRNHQCVS